MPIPEKLLKITEQSSAEDVQLALESVAGGGWKDDLITYLKGKLNSITAADYPHVTVLIAGMYGLVVNLNAARALGDGTIDPFLHKVRKAMLSCNEVEAAIRDNSSKYGIYAEFFHSFPAVKDRVVAIAKAHAGFDKGSEHLDVFFSLNGYFSYQETRKAFFDVVGSAGTTCVMTARGIYAAAGLKMFNLDRPPSVGTAGGPQFDLGMPTVKTNKIGKRIEVNSMQRADQQQFGARGYNNDDKAESNIPSIEPGDIFYLDGDGEFKQLLRKGVAFAAHVGVVVRRGGKMLDTVDGGTGNVGAKITLTMNRYFQFVPGAGWSISGADASFTGKKVAEIEGEIAKLKTPGDHLTFMQTHPGNFSNPINTWNRLTREKEGVKGNPALLKMAEKNFELQFIPQARRAIREAAKASGQGQQRTIHGWWKPSQYQQLAAPDLNTVRALLARERQSVPNARRMTIEQFAY